MSKYTPNSRTTANISQKKARRGAGTQTDTLNNEVLNILVWQLREQTNTTRDAHEAYTLARLLSIMLTQRANSPSKSLYACVRHARLGELLSRSRRTMIRHINALRTTHWLTSVKRWAKPTGSQKSNLYRPGRRLLQVLYRLQLIDSSKGDTRVTHNITDKSNNSSGGGLTAHPPPEKPPDGAKEANPDRPSAAKQEFQRMAARLKTKKV